MKKLRLIDSFFFDGCLKTFATLELVRRPAASLAALPSDVQVGVDENDRVALGCQR